MSDLLRQSIKEQPPPPRPRPQPINPVPENVVEDAPPSDSSSSSADSLASLNTIRPSSRDQPAPKNHWTNYFAQELYLDQSTDTQHARYHVYLTPATDPKKGPLFICHHGAGASGLSFAVLAQRLRHRLPEAGILSLEARGHGASSVTDPTTGAEIRDYSIRTLAADALAMITLTRESLAWPTQPPTILLGHSLGGAICTDLAAASALGTALVGVAVIDVVEGSALEALTHMKTYLASRPSVFNSIDDAVAWHTRSRTVRSAESAAVSVPSLLTQTPSGNYAFATDLGATAPYWSDWFTGMSGKFLAARGAKLLVLAGTDRLDKELMIGQMQGKFQLTVIPEAGHFVQEDVPERLAEVVGEFWRRNDRGALVLPPKVDELIAQGKKV